MSADTGSGRRGALAMDALLVGALAAGAYALKRHYAAAGPEALRWILAPTARVLELSTGSPWPYEAGVGYVSLAHATALVPGCAGVNFLIVAAATLVVGCVPRLERPGAKLACFVAALAIAFPVGVATNAARVLSDVALRGAAFTAALPHAEVHRVLGITVYLGAACLLHVAAGRALDRAVPRGAS